MLVTQSHEAPNQLRQDIVTSCTGGLSPLVEPLRGIQSFFDSVHAACELQHCNMARWKYKAPPVTFNMQYALRVALLLSYMEVYGSVDWEIVDESLGFEPD